MALTKVSRGLLTTSIVDNGNATAITIDSSEQVGIGTSSPQKTLDVNGTFAISNSTTSYWDFDRDNSDGSLKIADTGVERMRISGGNLLVGKTSTSFNTEGFLYEAGAAVEVTTDSNRVMRLNRTTNDGNVLEINKDGTKVGSIGTGSGSLFIGNTSQSSGISFYGTALYPNGGGSISATDGANDLGAPTARWKDLHLSGTASMTGLSPGIVTISSASYFIGNTASGYRFNNAADTSNLMILKDNGDLSIGTSGTGHRLFVLNAINAAQSNAQLRIAGSGYSAYHFLNGTAYHIGQNSNARSLRMYSGSNQSVGVQLNVGATSFGTFSDERLKQNIEPIEGAIESLSGLRTVKYHLKDADTSESTKRLGLIAQDLVGVLDEVIEPTTQAEDDTEYMAVRYTEIIPVLVKAIQEQQATIEALTQRIETLENT